MRNRRLLPEAEAEAEARRDLAMAMPDNTRPRARQSTMQTCVLSAVACVVLLLNLAQLSYYHLPSLHRFSARAFVNLPYRFQSPREDNSTYDPSQKSQDPLFFRPPPKPWPSLPSLLPWLARPALPLHSCEAFFGNGFTKRFDVFDRGSRSADLQKTQSQWLKRSRSLFGISVSEQLAEVKRSEAAGERTQKEATKELGSGKSRRDAAQTDSRAIGQSLAGSLHCFYSETLRTSICEGKNMVMRPGKIDMSAGGETIESVIGRTDEQELPSFSAGAFEIMVPPDPKSEVRDWTIKEGLLNSVLPQGQIHDHKMRSLIQNIRTGSSDQVICSEVK